MSISIGASGANGTYTQPFKSAGQVLSAHTPQVAPQTARSQALIAAAQQALTKANGVVDQDRRNHSPSCVACDQKLVDKAQIQLSEARATASNESPQTLPSPGSIVDLTA